MSRITAAATASGVGALETALRSRIQDGGPITFAELMELSLYHPTLGYYARTAPGSGSGYATSPGLSAWFGKLLCRHLESMWWTLDTPETFSVIEAGPGRGDLAASALGSAGGPFARAMRWVLVERFPAIRRVQEARLGPLASKASWVADLAGAGPLTGCVLANEVLDNFPVHLFEVGPSGPMEVCVATSGDRLAETLATPSFPVDPAAAQVLEEGDRFEVCRGLAAWCRDAWGALEAGYLLVIDYGDLEPEIWRRRPAGSLVTYSDGALGTDVLQSPGEQDITAHVNFSALLRSAAAAGFESQALVTQRELLDRAGAGEAGQQLREAQKQAEAGGQGGEALALMAERSRLQALRAKGGMGDFLVFAGSKRAGGFLPGGHERT